MNIYLDMVGCRLNQAEIDAMALDLVSRGGTIVSEAEKADVIIVNTCCVTAKASADSRKMIRHYQSNFDAKVVSTGCWVNVAKAEAEEISDLAYLNDQKELIPEFLLQSPADTVSEISRKPNLGKRNRTRGFVKVQDGCNNACSFCLTTIARGPSESMTEESVLGRVHQLESLGMKEIILTGVQLGSWGKELLPKKTLADLIQVILENSAIPRIRLSSIEPWDIDQALVDLLNHPRIMPHLHIPLQSGSDEILRAMRRPVSRERFRNVLEMIRRTAPQTAITTDVISGFPGETDEFFEESFLFIEECNFDGGHVFSFSPMPGTDALNLPDHVHQATIKNRTKRLLSHFAEQEKKIKESLIGQKSEVLFESRKKADELNWYHGFSENYQNVVCSSEEKLLNQIRMVEFTGIDQKGRLIAKIAE
jgi:threonylcarbamoyladenosine tRNA methylthiotransferase MtaB